MQLDVSKAFVKPGEPLPFEAEVTLAPQELSGESVSFDPVTLKGTYTLLDDTIRLEGELSTVAHAACARCLAPAHAPIALSFAETFRKDVDEVADEDFRYEGKSVPLDHMALTLVMLNLPMRFLCAENCAADLHTQAWDEEGTVWAEDGESDAPGVYHPFEGLKDLLDGNEPPQ